MKIEMIALDVLKPYDKNPRKISEQAVVAVAKSIEAHGFNQPIVTNMENVICVGHTRYLAAKRLGLKEVPVWRKEMTGDEFTRYNLADNKTGEISQWDVPLLQEIFVELEEYEATGFSEIEVQSLLVDGEGMASDEDDILGDEDEKQEEQGEPDSVKHKTFTLLIEEEDFIGFKSDIEKLQKHHGLSSDADTVLHVIRASASVLQ